MPSLQFRVSVLIGCVIVGSIVAAESLRCLAQTTEVRGAAVGEPRETEFRSRDANADQQLSQDEYTRGAGPNRAVLTREFIVFDADGDGRIRLTEFLTVPVGQPDDQRGTIPDPVVLLAEAHSKGLSEQWDAWDANGDAALSLREFDAAEIGKRVAGLEQATFADWDQNRDGSVTREEARLLLDVAFGVRTPQGELLRSKSGRVVDLRMFRQLKTDRDGFIRQEDYLLALGALDAQSKQQWLKTVDKNGDGKFNYAEFSTSGHRTDPVATFLDLDIDFDGRLSPDEAERLPADWIPSTTFLFPGFDDDRDGVLSLREFQLTPAVNLLADWHNAGDADGDGQLNLNEFRFGEGPALAALSAEYFRRLDVDQNRFLSLDECPFRTKHVSGIQSEIYVMSTDGSLMTIAIPGYPIICSPEISPDGRWVAVDGWRQGENNTAAHVFVASLESDEVLDFGIGCIPHWSADGRRFAYSKYGQGVFIRDFADEPNEILVDPQGWAIHFSADGAKTAYVRGGGNLVVHDVATGEKRSIFPEGQSPYRYVEHNFSWSPDSQRICFKGHRASGGVDVGIVTVTGDDPKLRVRYDGAKVQSDFAWHPDGKRIMCPMPGPKLQLFEFDPDGAAPPQRYRQQPKNRHNGGLSWSRDGKTLVYMSRR